MLPRLPWLHRRRVRTKNQRGGARPTGPRAAAGAAPSAISSARARIEGVAGAVYTAGVNTEERATHRITIRYRADFTAWAYLLEGTARRWRVRSVVDLDGTRRYLTILAEELTPEE